MIAALYVQTNGSYFNLSNVDPWDEARDARLYSGPHKVVAHPPCQRWGKMWFGQPLTVKLTGERKKKGDDAGCFEAALKAVRAYGGVLEHPAFSDAWKAFNLPRPNGVGWHYERETYVCEVWQSAYGHKARKRTWLLYVGKTAPANLNWDRPPGTHQIGFHDQRGKERNKPTISGKAASATPIEFRDALIELARSAT